MLLVCLLILIYPANASFNWDEELGPVQSYTSAADQEEAVNALLQRLVGPDQRFSLSVQPHLIQSGGRDFLKVNSSGGVVDIVGSSGVAVATGINVFFKDILGLYFSWDTPLPLALPDKFPEDSCTVVAQDRFRFYQNVCTWSYSFVWWGWAEWERHLDWMAMQGINLALAFSGQEEVWRRVYLQLGFTQQEIGEHFTGPAFLAWGRMGNLRGWAGPPGEGWRMQSSRLNTLIIKRMRELGMIPVLPAFSGQLPRAAKRLFPNATLTKLSCWNNFEDGYCCPYFLNPTDPLFVKIGSMFLKEYVKEYGTNHIYSCDSFNEVTPESSDLKFLRDVGRATHRSMLAVDSKAVWLLQGWMFHNNPIYWTYNRAKALLTSVPKGRLLVLDLQSELQPQFRKFNYYFGQPFIWCMLHNFGGTLGMHGSFDIINNDVYKARNETGTTMVGIGITPEGIFQNYIIYDFMLETGWRDSPTDLDKWIAGYIQRAYAAGNGKGFDAWMILKETVYNYTGALPIHGKYTIVTRPSLHLKPKVWYGVERVMEAWGLLLKAAETADTPAYVNDVVDLTRQALQLIFDAIYSKTTSAFRGRDLATLRLCREDMERLFKDMETILGSHSSFLLGVWIQSATSFASSSLEAMMLERNARNQITMWGPRSEIVDYANKQWSGLMKDYYWPRWKLFLDALDESLIKITNYNETELVQRIFARVEEPFTYSRKHYPSQPIGDPIQIAQDIYKSWCPAYCSFKNEKATTLR